MARANTARVLLARGVRAFSGSASAEAQAATGLRQYAALASPAAGATAGAASKLKSVAGSLFSSASRSQQLLPAAAVAGRAAVRGLFSAPAPEAVVEVDIGGEGGYFDHDESHAGLEQRETIAALFDKWNEALATLDPEKVADMYGPGAVLLPTVSNEVRTTREGILDYFTSFLKLKPQGKVDQSHIRMLSRDMAMHSGVYTFTIHPSDEETKLVQARFTYLYRLFNGEWKIAEHHSSTMPEQKPAGVEDLFDKWNAALQTGNPEIVADLYAPDGVLLPTVSNQVRTSRKAIVDYFENFLKLKPYGKINNSIVREPSPGVAINSGVYTFKLTRPETGRLEDVQARYTFIYKKINDQWYIAEHHSSAMPEN